MWIKGIFLLLFALTIDALQAIVAWMFLAAGSAIALVPLVGVVGPPLGIGLGFAVDVAISLTMGSGLVLALFLFGMFDLKYVSAVFISEAVPGLDVVPGWTFLVIRCILKKNTEEKNGIVGVASKIASAVISPESAVGGLGTIAQGISSIKGATGGMARSSPFGREVYDSEPMQDNARERTSLALDVGKEISARPNQLHAKAA